VSSLGGRVERSYRSAHTLGARGLGVVEAASVLERLADRGWVERGFKVTCPACGMSSFIPVALAPSRTICPQCHKNAELVRSRFGVEVHYRLDAFADRCSDQGVIPHAAVGAVLLESHPFSALQLGSNITWDDGSVAEVDIFGFLGSRVVAGEVKTSATEFTDKQIDRDIALSGKLGAQTHILAYVWPRDDLRFLARARSRWRLSRFPLNFGDGPGDRHAAITGS